jgi:hypothetical protein
MSDSTIETKAKAAKDYLEKDVVPILTKALAKMCVEEPDDPYMWLAKVHSVASSSARVHFYPHRNFW